MLALEMAQTHTPSSAAAQPPVCEATGFRDFIRRPVTIIGSYRKRYLSADLIAGLTVAAVAIPQAIAYASIAELPPHYGLYTAAIAAIVGALWGCSRFLATGPVNAISLLVLPILLGVAVPGTPEYLLAASVIAVLAGLFSIALSLLNFGALVTLASRSVLVGFTAGAAVHIAVGQTRHLLGLDFPAMPELQKTVAALVAGAGEVNPASLALGLGTLVALIVLGRIGPRFPAALVCIAGAGLIVWLADLQAYGVHVVGQIPRSLPPPTWIATGMLPDLQMIRGLILGSMAVAALGLIEAVASSQTLARRSGDRLNNNQEFFGQGLANIASGLFSGYPCSGSFTRSALAQQSGAQTHIAGVVTGLAVLLGMLLFAPWASLVPRPAIAGVLLVVAWRMVDREGIRRVLRTSRSETAVMTITFLATLVLPLDFAVLAGVVFSLAFFVVRSSLPRVVPVVPDATYRHFVHDPSRPACPQLGVLNIRGPLFFGAVYHIEEELRHNHEQHPGQNHLVLRLHGVDICDLTGVEMLESTVKTYRQQGGDVFLIRPRGPVRKTMEQSGFLDGTLGRDHVLEQEGAIEQLFDRVLDPVICTYECEHRVFAECQALEKHPYDEKLPPAPAHPHIPGRHVSPLRFEELAAEPDALVIDVREPEEHRQGHVPGAELIPLRMLLEKAPDLPRDRTLLLACRSGRRTSRAIRMLEDMGHTRLYGLGGGILAWRAAGLRMTAPVEERAIGRPRPRFRPLPVAEQGRQRHTLAAMRAKHRAEAIAAELEGLETTRDLAQLRETLDRTLDQVAAARPGSGGVVVLDPALPVLIVSCARARRGALGKLLRESWLGAGSNLEAIVQGKQQLLLLGDLLHSENESRWQEVEREFAATFASPGGDTGATPVADAEMADGFGLAAMVLALQVASPGVHSLKGSHDNVLNSGEGGNAAVSQFASRPGEGEITRVWTLNRFGSSLAGKYAAWENRLPLLAAYDCVEGPRFIATHSAPARPYTREEIEAREERVVRGLTWTREGENRATDLLSNFFGPGAAGAWYVSGRPGGAHDGRLAVIHESGRLVAVLVRPGVEAWEPRVIAED